MIKNRLQFIFGFLLVSAVIIWAGYFTNSNADTNNTDHIYFLDVGQGDSEYIKLRDGSDILIDGGPDQKVLTELGRVMDFGDRKIDLVILTHPHADHLTGLISVINRFEIGEVWESGVEYPSSVYDQWKNDIKTKNISDSFVTAGKSQSFNFGQTKFSVLYPLLPEKNLKIDDLNNSSVITQLSDGRISFLFLGDAQLEAQQKILNQLNLITVLKVGHHGSSNGTLDDLLKITRPAVGVIEVGKDNTYGHPASSVINLLKSYAVRIYRTDQNGTVEISTDGKSYNIKTNF
ncbi:TPA: MBL fold metallo-hydrolase [Candidatus Berkelbacteria bacterium]|uniref:Internalization-like protein competence protein ComEC/Rec2, competence protein ComEC protein n=1 Tax=Berkelbacteria bacterium GW2011_GWE1_39_12 TaxID=1618337 RepID=A0A0G4B4V4_9BACT|nr:MAG: internalization-like protein competence protein ComEC/Rec2, competence protein ComEC protein [Berkelbacteria bacterium GW2011_GWE1_39_12]HBO61030.1 MBL fold metallo-hydrolase [Candidatus Berkelbacteria bacterium]